MKRMLFLLAAWAMAWPVVTVAGTPPPFRDFYVSPAGSDAAPGTSSRTAWRTLARAESAALRPGDRVHLQGGATFTEPLAPFAGTAGTNSDPIIFDSYGQGRATLTAGIYLNSVSDLAFQNLEVTSTGRGVLSSAAGAGASGITLRDLAISNIPLAGISSNNARDSDWLIDRISISHTGDSGIYFVGSDFTISGSRIVDTGTRSSIGYPRHGIYAAGPAPRIVGNTIASFSTSGVSLRYQNGVVVGNRITGGARGVSFEEQASTAGTTRIAHNTISDVSDGGIVVARPAFESFVFADNTIETAGAYGAVRSGCSQADDREQHRPGGERRHPPAQCPRADRDLPRARQPLVWRAQCRVLLEWCCAVVRGLSKRERAGIRRCPALIRGCRCLQQGAVALVEVSRRAEAPRRGASAHVLITSRESSSVRRPPGAVLRSAQLPRRW